MSPYCETHDRAQQLRNYLHQSHRNWDALEGYDKHTLLAERALGTLMGDEATLHAWIEPTPATDISKEGTIRVLFSRFLLSAAYEQGTAPKAHIELLNHVGLYVQTRWNKWEGTNDGWPDLIAITLNRPQGDLTFEVENDRPDSGRVEHILNGLDSLRPSMTTPTP